MAHESFEDEATAAYLNEHYVSVKVDREERPDVDAVYMQATVAMTGHGGWPMTCVLDHEGSPFFAGTYFPDQPRHGQPSFRQVLEAIDDAWTNRADDVAQAAARIRDALARSVGSPAARPFDARGCSTPRSSTLARDFDARDGGFGTAPKFPPSMVLEFLLRHGSDASRSRWPGRTLAAMAAGGHPRPARAAGSRATASTARWVVPHFEKMLYDNAQLLAVYARWAGRHDDAGAPGRPRDRRLPARELAPPRAASPPRWTPTPRATRAPSTSGPRPQLVEVLGPDDGAWAADAALGHRARAPSSTAPPRCSCARTPTTRAAGSRCGSRLLAARAEPGAARPRRQGGRRLERAGDQRPRRGRHAARRRRSTSRRRSGAASSWPTSHLDDGRLLRVSRDGVAGRHAGVLEDYGCVAAAFLALAGATGDGSGWTGPVPCSTRC